MAILKSVGKFKYLGMNVTNQSCTAIFNILVRKPEGRRQLRRPGHNRWEVRIEMDLREINLRDMHYSHLS
jgi:hypothetical protein